MKKLWNWLKSLFGRGEPDLDNYYKTESVTASLAMKINIGNYENMEVFASMTLKGLRHENLSKKFRERARELMYDRAWDVVGAEVNKKFDYIVKTHGRVRP